VVAGEPNRGGDVVSRGRLEDKGRKPGHHAIPDRNGIVPTLVAGAQQPALDPRAQVVEVLGSEADGAAVEAGGSDGAGGHDVTSPKPVGCPVAGLAGILQTPVTLCLRLEYVKTQG
jgi:hypothetical protein